MIKALRNRVYRHLFLAQVIALIGTGLTTVALGLLAYQLAGKDAGAVLGTALAIKMIAYVGVAPIAGAIAGMIPRRPMLVALDVVRAVIALCLPFVTEIWQVYALIFALQSASAAFTPTFQATIPDVLPDEDDYTNALSLSRLAYEMESVASPVLAAGLLTVITFHGLFAGTALGFLASAALVLSVSLPKLKLSKASGFFDRLTRGTRIYLAPPRLRGLLALHLAAAAGASIVFVNNVVIVRTLLGLGDREVAVALGAFGLGSMATALALPRLLGKFSDRSVMVFGAGAMAFPLAGMALALWLLSPPAVWALMLILWGILGICYAMAMTPSGRLLRRSSTEADRPALFAADFALSHACWLITYPLAGWLGAAAGMPAVIAVHLTIAALAAILAMRLWPADDPGAVGRQHGDLDPARAHRRTQPAVRRETQTRA